MNSQSSLCGERRAGRCQPGGGCVFHRDRAIQIRLLFHPSKASEWGWGLRQMIRRFSETMCWYKPVWMSLLRPYRHRSSLRTGAIRADVIWSEEDALTSVVLFSASPSQKKRDRPTRLKPTRLIDSVEGPNERSKRETFLTPAHDAFVLSQNKTGFSGCRSPNNLLGRTAVYSS